MSNHLAIATVTATLKRSLSELAALAVPMPGVTTGRPDVPPSTPQVASRINLYLYQVHPSAALSNADLPTRGADGQLRMRPQIALELDYLLSFYGDEAELVPDRLLATVVRGLHARPVLTREQLLATVARATDPVDSEFPFLAGSDLVEQSELVKLTPVPLSLEELSKLWSVFVQIPYVVSTAYRASVVLLDEDVSPAAVLPVRRRNVYTLASGPPLVERVVRADDESAPITAGALLIVRGRRLAGDATTVWVGGEAIVPPPESVSPEAVEVALPPALRAGLHRVRVTHELALGTPAVPHRGFDSNAVAVALHPTVTSVLLTSVTSAPGDPVDGELTLVVAPEVGEGQEVVLLLNEVPSPPAGPPAAFRFAGPEVTAPTNTLVVPVSELVATQYIVRVRIDGVESPVELAVSSPSFGPTVTVA